MFTSHVYRRSFTVTIVGLLLFVFSNHDCLPSRKKPIICGAIVVPTKELHYLAQ